MASFWDDCTAFFEQLQRHFNTNDVLLADRLATRGHDYVHVISVIRSRVATATSEHDDTQQLIQQMVSDLSAVGQELEDMVEHFEAISIGPDNMQNAGARVILETTRTGTPGRPPYVIPRAQIEAMVDLGLNYEQMAQILGVSSRTLRRHRQQLDMPVGTNYADISDAALDAQIRSILNVRKLCHS